MKKLKTIADKFFCGDEKRMYIYFFISFVFLMSITRYVFTPREEASSKFFFIAGVIFGACLCAEFKNCMESYREHEELEEMQKKTQLARENAKKRQKINPFTKRRMPDGSAPLVFKVDVTNVSGPKPIKEAALSFLNKRNQKPEKPSADDSKNNPGKASNTSPKDPPSIVKPGQSKAEQQGNVVIGDDGKPVVKPNYKMIASEWVTANLDLLNKICNDAFLISGGEGSYKATIPKKILPPEQASWVIIGKTLVEGDDITNFSIGKNGLEITVE